MRKYTPVWYILKGIRGCKSAMKRVYECSILNDCVTYEELVKNKDEYTKESLARAKYVINNVTANTEEHFYTIIERCMNDISLRTKDFGFTEMVLGGLKSTNQPVTFDIYIYKDMPNGFDPVAYGNELNSLLTND